MRGIAKSLEIFSSKKPFQDRMTDDMRYGDMSEKNLKQKYGLIAVSDRVDPYSFKKLHLPAYGDMPILSREEAAAILFEQLQFESVRFAFWGPYKNIIKKIFSHMQLNDGRDFYDAEMSQAYKRMIERDVSATSTKMAIINTLNTFNKWNRGLSARDFSQNISQSNLPIFNRLSDRINGVGISIHQINSTKIIIEQLHFERNKYTATLLFKGQNHFGLDATDIQDTRFKYLQIFRIWFVLQHYEKLAYKPFFTNMEARIKITGENNA